MNRGSNIGIGCVVAFMLLAIFAIFGTLIAGPAIGIGTSGTRATALRQQTTVAQSLIHATVAPKKSSTSRPAPTPLSTEVPGRLVELTEAVAQKLIQVTIIGDSLEIIQVNISPLTMERLMVQVQAGTIFQPVNDSTQAMVLRSSYAMNVFGGVPVTQFMNVACAEMHKNGPSNKDTFTIKSATAPSALLKLMALTDFKKQSFRMQQFAIWTITNNPQRRGYVGIGIFGMGSGPTDDEITLIKQLFTNAGIPTTDYQALR
jgi:hypothetical protein